MVGFIAVGVICLNIGWTICILERRLGCNLSENITVDLSTSYFWPYLHLLISVF